MAPVVLTLLGGFHARPRAGIPAIRLGQKAQALLAFLAASPGVAHSRDKLMAILWSSTPEEQARHSVRQALFTLRKALAPVAPAMLQTEGERVAVSPDAVEVDVVALERLATQATREALEQAVALYRGDLLEGLRIREPPYEEWLSAERERLRTLVLDPLERLLIDYTETGATPQATRTAVRLLTLDPLREAAHRALMRLSLQTGQRAVALRQYRTCAKVLDREFGVAPDAETRRLYLEIVAERPAPSPVVPVLPRVEGKPPLGSALIVHDEPVLRAALDSCLAGAGYDVVTARNGAEALAQIGRTRFDLVLVDPGVLLRGAPPLVEILTRTRTEPRSSS